jgi:histidyl-tRNA synthetase
MAKKFFQHVTGMHDILFEDQKYFQKVYSLVKEFADFYDFKLIETPILEEAKLFLTGVGASTDVVKKQMFVFKTQGKDIVALRPEGTAPVCRSYIEHGMFNLPQPVKLWYFGPFFRYERPQLGRTREFHQFGFEVLGKKASVIDVQIIKICYNILEELKIQNLSLEINSIGCKKCRPIYRKVLKNYLKKREKDLCYDCKKRIKENPLRVLDCKVEKCQKIIENAPQTLDYLCQECRSHFKEVLEFLDTIELPYFLNTHLVRGLDYYTKTVFEISNKDEVGQKIGALVGGGRYDDLVKLLGGKNTPACGASGGVERIVALMKAQNIELKEEEEEESIFFAQLGDLARKKGLKILEELKKAKIKVKSDFTKDSLKSQLKLADKFKTRYVLIFGQKEAMENTIIIKDMKKGQQESVKLESLIKRLKKKI